MSAPSPKKRELRLLALHGHYQSGEIFRKQTGALRKILVRYGVTFVHYPTSPHKLPTLNESGEEIYTWFNWEPQEKWQQPSSYIGVDETIAFLKQQFVEYGPFDGVLGFSQGGIVLSVLAGMRTTRELASASGNPIAFDFAIFAASFAPPLDLYRHYAEISNTCAPLSTLHIYGLKDVLVPVEKSKHLAAIFDAQSEVAPTDSTDSERPNSTTIYKVTSMHIEHPGGHFVATDKASKEKYREFFESLPSST